MRRARKLFLTAAVAALAAVAVAVPANAATVGIDQQGVLRYQGAASEANNVRVYFDVLHWVYVIEDQGATATTVTGKWCTSYSPQVTYCTTGRFSAVDVQLGDAGGSALSQVSLVGVTLRAGAGDDTLTAGPGHTTLIGGGGQDTLTAGKGPVDMIAGSGATTMNGGAGRASYQGGPGADTVNGRNGLAEEIACAGAEDVVTADDGDTVASDCESVTRGVAAPPADAPDTEQHPSSALPGDLPGVVAKPPAPLAIAPATATLRNNSVPVRVTCPEASATGCEGTLTLSLPASKASSDKVVAARRRVVSRSRRYRLKAGEKAVVPVRLTRRGARIFRARRGGRRIKRSSRRRKLVVTATVKTEAGVKTVRSTITVHERRRPMPKKRARRN
jgi:hypothetical protein